MVCFDYTGGLQGMWQIKITEMAERIEAIEGQTSRNCEMGKLRNRPLRCRHHVPQVSGSTLPGVKRWKTTI
jgi:hypothetical protein